MSYFSTKHFSNEWGLSVKIIQKYCKDGQIPGCRKTGGKWEIPSEALRPVSKSNIPFLLMYYNCIQTEFDVRTTNIPYIQKFIALDYGAEARKYLIQMGYMNKIGACTPAGIAMMNRALSKQQKIALGKWVVENIPQYLQFLPYFFGG